MTAEIAVLNKMAVALAADSAVTISSSRSKEYKIYDTADKLFELSHKNPIGVMIYNGMHFMDAPFQILINKFRQDCKEFDTVRDAATSFLNFLNEFGGRCSNRTSDVAISQILIPLISMINKRATDNFSKLFEKQPFPQDITKAMEDTNREVIELAERIYSRADQANFIGGKSPIFTKTRIETIRNIVHRHLELPGQEPHERVINLCKMALQKDILSDGRTGLVFAGFGKKELFPTLISFEIDGVIFGRLKFVETNYVDIDRDGARAKVVPFAQKEMVERFLYGLDGDIERNIATFCRNAVSEIKDEILNQLVMPDQDKEDLRHRAEAAELAFVSQLQKTGFEKIRTQSKTAIEDMVEFMPKPELATMAEGLVNLTSIKRRFSRGMETVGGPIDVAVISQSEGFVWVKRKHYFTPELNPRYIGRVNRRLLSKGDDHG